MRYSVVFILLWVQLFSAQQSASGQFYSEDTLLSERLRFAVTEAGIGESYDCGEDGIEQISLAVISLKGGHARFGGVHPDNFIYPASVYKMYVAAEILRQIAAGERSLTDRYICRASNMVDTWREISTDPRPLLREGDTVTVNYLLDLMITRSDNSAANCLIDLADRKKINALMHSFGWKGSEVTRKFLKRKYEDPGYEKIRGTETNARHAAEFMLRVENGTLVSPWVSQQMKCLLGRQLDNSKLAPGLPPNTMFYHKTGWFSFWTNDAGIVDDGETRYIVACFLPIPETDALLKMKSLSRSIYEIMKNY